MKSPFSLQTGTNQTTPNENLRIFILRYQDLHAAATGKTAAEDTDPTHIIRFLGMMTNSEIARKISQKGIPEGMTLGQAFTRAIELEAGYQLSEGVSLARPTEIMQVQEVEEVDEIGLGQRRSKDVVCWQCGEKGHLQRDCPHKETDDQIEGMDDPNAYAGRSEQIIRINQPITVATRDNIYKQMGSQRTKANIYKAGYRKTKAALQEQQKINAAITSTLAAQKATQAPAMQPAVAQTPVVQQQPVQAPSQPAQIIQIPATSGPSAPVNVQSPQGNVRYIRLPPGVIKGTYNLRPTSLNNPRMAKVSTSSPAATANVTKGKTNLQNNQVKQEPASPGMPTTPKTTSTTTVVRKGKGKGKQVSTVSVLDTVQDEGEYPIEVEGEEFEDSDSDATELYEILANITEPEEEVNLGVEPELDPPIRLPKGYEPEKYCPYQKYKRGNLFVNMVTIRNAMGATIPVAFGQTRCNVLIDTGVMKSCMSQTFYQQLMLPTMRNICTYQVKSTTGSNLCPMGITGCEFKIGDRGYKTDFVVCKNLTRPCILGIDF